LSQSNLDNRTLRRRRISSQKLRAGRDKIFIARRHLQAVDQFEHDILMSAVCRMSGDEFLGNPDEPEDPAVFIIQIDQRRSSAKHPGVDGGCFGFFRSHRIHLLGSAGRRCRLVIIFGGYHRHLPFDLRFS